MPTTLNIYNSYTPGMVIATGRAALDTGPNPPEIVLNQADVDALTNGGVLDVTLVKDHVRVALQDDATVDALNAGAINAISGLRQKPIRDENVAEQTEGHARALAELQRITQGSFQLNFNVRTTTEDWRPGQQFKLRMPAKNIVFIMTVSSVNTDEAGTLSDGREEMLHKCVAQLSTRDPLWKLLKAIALVNTPAQPSRIRYEPV